MSLELASTLLLQGAVFPDTIVTLTAPAELTLFDYTSGILQILVLLVGVIALGAMAALALTLRRGVMALQSTAERLSGDIKPLLYQATRVSEEANAMVKTVRKEVDRLSGTSEEINERVRELTDAAGKRVAEVNALLDVLQDEVQDTALSAAANLRGLRVGALALGSALAGGQQDDRPSGGPRIRRRDEDAPLFDDELADDDELLDHDDDELLDDNDELLDDDDELPDDDDGESPEDDPEQHRPYFDTPRRRPTS